MDNASNVLPPRHVEDREKELPALSITYRIFAQLEIWCMERGGSAVDNYCRLFEKMPGSPNDNLKFMRDMLRRGNSEGRPDVTEIKRIVDHIAIECKESGERRIIPNPKRKLPLLTALYRHYVIFENEKVILPPNWKEDLVCELHCRKLIW